jgi:hypothetical protein
MATTEAGEASKASGASGPAGPNTGDPEVDTLLTGLAAKDRSNIEKHLAACDAEPSPAHGKLWRKVAVALRKLAPLPVQTAGQHAVQFFIPDGKYRMQVFALEDGNNGQLMIYLPDVLAEAQKSGLLSKRGAKAPGEVAADVAAASAAGAGGSGAQEYAIRGSKGAVLRLEALDAANTPNPAAHIKNMLGWNRKALRVTVLTVSPPEQIAAAEALCALAARKWAGKTATPATGKPPTAKS